MRAMMVIGLVLLGGCDELADSAKDAVDSDTPFNGEVTDKDSFDAAFVQKYCGAWDACDMQGACQQNDNNNSGCNFQQDAADACLAAAYTCGLLGPDIPMDCLAVCG